MADDKLKAFGLWHRIEKGKDEDLVKDLWRYADHLARLAKPRLEREAKHLKLYNPDPSGNLTDFRSYLRRDHPSFNMIRQAVDTMTAQVFTQKYMPRYVVTEGEFDLQRVARLRRRVLEGQVYDKRVDALMRDAGNLAATLGTQHIHGTNDPVSHEPTLALTEPGTVFVDPYTTIDGKATMGVLRRARPLSELKARYPNVPAHMLESSAKATPKDRELCFLPRDTTVEELIVVEAYQAPIGEQKGRHVVCTSKALLLDEEWDEPVPLVPVHYLKRQIGYWGIGLAEMGADEQARMERLLARVEQAHEIDSTIYLMATGQQRFSGERVAGVDCVRVFRTAGGGSPEFKVFRGTADHLSVEVDRIRERFLAVTGISAMAAQNEKPAGVTSAVGQRTFADLTKERYRVVGGNFQDAWRDVIELLERLNARAQQKEGGYSVSARTTRGAVPLVRTVKWGDAHMKPEQYRLSLQLVSDVPYMIGGRTEALQEWVGSGYSSRMFSQKQFLDSPDESLNQLETIQLDYVMWQVEQCLDDKEYVPVLDPRQHAPTVADVISRVFLHIKSGGAPEEVLTKLMALESSALAAMGTDKPVSSAPAAPQAPGLTQPLGPPGQALPPGMAA